MLDPFPKPGQQGDRGNGYGDGYGNGQGNQYGNNGPEGAQEGERGFKVRGQGLEDAIGEDMVTDARNYRQTLSRWSWEAASRTRTPPA